ncbi:MAG: hypothetical protein ACTSQE_06070 [Candidatus Heimdallarchaeaceae archaeon]
MKRRGQSEKRWLMYPYRFAHHPICDKFSEHFYTIKGVKVCRGCFNLYAGQFVGIILAFISVFVLHISYWIPFIVTYALFAFTPLSITLHPPRKIKDFFRILLGIAIVSSYLVIILAIIELFQVFSFGGVIVIVLILLTHILARIILVPLREKDNRKACETCEQFTLPRCEGMKYVYDRVISLKSFRKGDAFSEE